MRSRPRARLTLAVLALDVAILASGAVAVARHDGSWPPESGPGARAVVVKALAEGPADHGSTVRWAHALFAEAPGIRELRASSEGVIDFEHVRVSGQMRIFRGETFDFYMDDRFEYHRESGEQNWDKRERRARDLFDPVPKTIFGDERDSGALAFLPDPEVRRRIVDATIASVAPGVAERVRGVDTRRYRVRLETSRQDSLDATTQAQADAWGSLIEDSLEADVSADADGRLRKLSVVVLPFEGAGFRIEDEWWDFGDAPEVAIPPDLGDPTATGGPGVSSFQLSGGPVGEANAVDSTQGGEIDILQSESDDFPQLHFTAYERIAPDHTRFWAVLTGMPRGVGEVLPAGVSVTTRTPLSGSLSPFEPVANCDEPEGSLTVTGLVVDAEGRVVRFAADFTLTCPGRPAVRGQIRYRWLD